MKNTKSAVQKIAKSVIEPISVSTETVGSALRERVDDRLTKFYVGCRIKVDGTWSVITRMERINDVMYAYADFGGDGQLIPLKNIGLSANREKNGQKIFETMTTVIVPSQEPQLTKSKKSNQVTERPAIQLLESALIIANQMDEGEATCVATFHSIGYDLEVINTGYKPSIFVILESASMGGNAKTTRTFVHDDYVTAQRAALTYAMNKMLTDVEQENAD